MLYHYLTQLIHCKAIGLIIPEGGKLNGAAQRVCTSGSLTELSNCPRKNLPTAVNAAMKAAANRSAATEDHSRIF